MQQFDQSQRDGKSQPETLRHIGLIQPFERSENTALLFVGQTRSRVGNFDRQFFGAIGDMQGNRAAYGELHGIGEQIADNLQNAVAVTQCYYIIAFIGGMKL